MKTIEGVPDSITRADYVHLIESVGLDPNKLRSLEFRVDAIYAEVKAVHPAHGKDYPDRGLTESDEVATHRIHIPVVG